MGVEIAERIVQKGGSPLRDFLWILPNPYKMPGPEPTGFILFWVDFPIIFKSFNSLSSEVILYSSFNYVINLLTDRNSQFRKLGVVIKNFFSGTYNKNTYLRLQPCYLYLISKLRCFRVFWQTIKGFKLRRCWVFRWILLTRKLLVWGYRCV